MKILISLGHPAHYHLFKHVAAELTEAGHDVQFIARPKDVLLDFLSNGDIKYEILLSLTKRFGKIGQAADLVWRDLHLFKLARRFRPDLLIGSTVEIAHVGYLLRRPSIILTEDDWHVIPLVAKYAYPFTDLIVAPHVVRMGKWAHKTLRYEGYHELAYLHPGRFIPDESRIASISSKGERYFILRFAELTAHHDVGRAGISTTVARAIIDRLKPHGRILITSEGELEPEFERYRLRIDPSRMHDALYFADLYIGDSQTMAAEAAVLGTPSLRFNDFVGEIGYLEELEHRYGLTFGFRTSVPEKLLEKISELLSMTGLTEEWQRRRETMLNGKIELTSFLYWLITNYPESAEIARNNTNFQYQFG